MAISFIGSNTAVQNSGTTIAVATHASTQIGDLLLAVVLAASSAGAPTVTPITSGWTLISGVSSSANSHHIFAKIADANGSSNQSFSSTQAFFEGTIAITSHRGALLGNTTAWGSSTTEPVAPTVTTAKANAVLVCAFGLNGLGSGVSGMTLRASRDNGTRDVAVFDQVIASPGATGTRTYTGGDTGRGVSVALEDAATANRIRMMV